MFEMLAATASSIVTLSKWAGITRKLYLQFWTILQSYTESRDVIEFLNEIHKNKLLFHLSSSAQQEIKIPYQLAIAMPKQFPFAGRVIHILKKGKIYNYTPAKNYVKASWTLGKSLKIVLNNPFWNQHCNVTLTLKEKEKKSVYIDPLRYKPPWSSQLCCFLNSSPALS